MKVLDTDTCIAILRGQNQVIDRRAAEMDAVATTWMTAAELYFGAAKSNAPGPNRQVVEAFLSTLVMLESDAQAASVFGQNKAFLQRAGLPVADADLIIASIALANGATLVTGNRRHFERIPQLKLLDWIRS